MARVMAQLCALTLALAAMTLPAHARTLAQAGGARNIRWCVPAAANSPAIAACNSAMAQANTAAVSFTCVAGTDMAGCAELVGNGGAELTTQQGRSMLVANEEHGLEAIIAESYAGLDTPNYYSVAVVRAADCAADTTLESLRGKRSCHTGYGRTAGWTLPVGFLIGSGTVDVVNSDDAVKADAQSLAAFFSGGVCAAGNGANVDGSQWDGQCTACGGDCSTESPYYDYAGTIRGLIEDACDVAFTKHATPLEVLADGENPEVWAGTNTAANFRLVCPTGGCRPLADFASCNIAQSPSYAVMTTAAIASQPIGQQIQDALLAVGNDTTFLNAARNLGGLPGFAFSPDTEALLEIDQPFTQYFGANTKLAFDRIAELESAPATPAAPTPAAPTPATPTPAAPAGGAAATAVWCIPASVSNDVLQACKAAVAEGNTDDVAFDCVVGGSLDACTDRVSKGTADLVVLGGTQQLPAFEEFGLQPVAAEQYSDAPLGASYFSVAVVPASFCSNNPTFADLRGKRSCHTGYRRTAGWTLPIGFLTQEGVIPRVDAEDAVQADAESVASFFSATCAPGTQADGPALGGGAWPGMCTACKGDCTTEDPYIDYDGSLRCMFEDSGDVSFTKHSTVLEVVSDGTNPQPWARASSEVRLLCPNGGCATIDQYETCNIARAPGRAVMTRADVASGPTGAAIRSALNSGGEALANSLKTFGGETGLLIGETAVSLGGVTQTTEQYVTPQTKAAYEGIAALDALASQGTGAPAAPAAPAPSGGSSGVSSGAAAGIGIGCAVAGILIGVVAMVVYSKKKARWQPHTDAAPVMPTSQGSEAWGGNGKI